MSALTLALNELDGLDPEEFGNLRAYHNNHNNQDIRQVLLRGALARCRPASPSSSESSDVSSFTGSSSPATTSEEDARSEKPAPIIASSTPRIQLLRKTSVPQRWSKVAGDKAQTEQTAQQCEKLSENPAVPTSTSEPRARAAPELEESVEPPQETRPPERVESAEPQESTTPRTRLLKRTIVPQHWTEAVVGLEPQPAKHRKKQKECKVKDDIFYRGRDILNLQTNLVRPYRWQLQSPLYGFLNPHIFGNYKSHYRFEGDSILEDYATVQCNDCNFRQPSFI